MNTIPRLYLKIQFHIFDLLISEDTESLDLLYIPDRYLDHLQEWLNPYGYELHYYTKDYYFIKHHSSGKMGGSAEDEEGCYELPQDGEFGLPF